MLLEKHNFLRMPEVSDFSDWLSEMSDKLRVELKIKKSRFVENEIETNCVGFQKFLIITIGKVHGTTLFQAEFTNQKIGHRPEIVWERYQDF